MQYKDIELDEADRGRVRDLNDKTVGVQRFMQTMMEMGERRTAELQSAGRDLFKEFEKKYGLDLARVTYQPSPDGSKLIPMYVNLHGEMGGKQ